MAWFERSNLHYTRSLFALWLAEGQLALGQQSDARILLETVVAKTRENGYRHLEGVAERLLGEALGPGDPAAVEHLDLAHRVLEEVGARNDIAKVLVARARCHLASGDATAAGEALKQAKEMFASLGTVDGPILAGSLLDSLPAKAEAGDIAAASS